jgi:hypothetical protein
MAGKDKDIEWLVKRMEKYHLLKSDTEDVVEEIEDIGKLGDGSPR